MKVLNTFDTKDGTIVEVRNGTLLKKGDILCESDTLYYTVYGVEYIIDHCFVCDCPNGKHYRKQLVLLKGSPMIGTELFIKGRNLVSDKEALIRMVNCLSAMPVPLRGTLDEWDSFDEDLQYSYCDDIDWIFGFIKDHKDEISADPQLTKLVDQARIDFLPLVDDIKKITGRQVDF